MPARKTYHNHAIVLDRRARLGEKDLILEILLDSGESASIVAKGALKPGSRFSAAVELFSEGDFLLVKGRNLDILSEAKLSNAHPQIRGSMEKLSAASAVAEISSATSYADFQDAYLFNILSAALSQIELCSNQQELDLIVSAFVFKLLAHVGYYPVLDACASCADKKCSHFSSSMGGLVCSSCAKETAGCRDLLIGETQLLRDLLQLRFDEIRSKAPSLELSTEVLSLMHEWAAIHLDKRFKAFEFLLSL